MPKSHQTSKMSSQQPNQQTSQQSPQLPISSPEPNPESESNPAPELYQSSLFEHLEELRVRIFYALIAWGVAFAVAFNYRLPLLELMQTPLGASKLYQQGQVQVVTQNLTDQFLLSVNLSFWTGLALSLPFLLLQVWLFVSPGLYAHERRWALPFVIGGGFSFLGGALFGYHLVLPTMVGFLLDFLGGTVTPLLNLRDYIGTVTTFLVAFGLSFELPILVAILTRIGLVHHQMLRRVWRFALIGILIFAAILTPTPDPMSMMLVAAPLYALYELSIVLSRLLQVPASAESEESETYEYTN